MTRIKLCGLSRSCDIDAANILRPEYIGFVFAQKSKRFVGMEQAAALRQGLATGIKAVGVFVNEKPERIAALLNQGIIDLAQLHGDEDENDIRRLRELTDCPIIQALRVRATQDLEKARASSADYILLDSGAGTGISFDWSLLRDMERPYFLAGGLSPENVGEALKRLHPFAVDVSSGIETRGIKDKEKMAAFVAAVREEDRR